MKLKLAALLFSQAAVNAVEINKDNYKQHLCTLDSLKAMPKVITESSSVPSWVEQANKDNLESHYSVYCQNRGKYEEAVEFSNTHSWRVNTDCFPTSISSKELRITKEACVEKTGIAYAKSCEDLKAYKSSHPATWNSVESTLKACNTAKRL